MSEHTPFYQTYLDNKARQQSIQQKTRALEDLIIQLHVEHANFKDKLNRLRDQFFDLADQTHHALQPLSRDVPREWLDESEQIR